MPHFYLLDVWVEAFAGIVVFSDSQIGHIEQFHMDYHNYDSAVAVGVQD